jgi:hypothetical protein
MMTGPKAKPVHEYSITDISDRPFSPSGLKDAIARRWWTFCREGERRVPEKNGNENFSFPFFILTPCLEEQGMKQGEIRNYN